MATKKWKEANQEKLKGYRNAWYERNIVVQREKARERQAKRRIEFKAWFDEFKKTLKCSKCGFAHPAALDFHHENPTEKEYNIAYLKHNGSKESILKEMEKCIVLCSNCHRIHHFNE